MNRAEIIRQIFLWEKTAEQAQARAARFRAMLQADANAEFEEQGTAPTWRLADIASVVLPVSKTSVVVQDETALVKWAKQNAASEVVERVNPAYIAALRKNSRIDGDTVTDKDGTVIPGLAVKPGGKPGSVTLRPETEAAEVAAEAAEQVLDLVATSLHLPSVPEVDPQPEGGDDAPAA